MRVLHVVLKKFLLLAAGAGIFMGEAVAADYGPPFIDSVAQRAVFVASEALPPAASQGATDLPAQKVAANQPIGPDPGPGFSRLPGHVLGALARAVKIASTNEDESMDLSMVLNRDDQAGFERYLKRVYDSNSREYRHFFSQAKLTKRFGPSAQSYAKVCEFLKRRGFTRIRGSHNRMTITVHGSRSIVERAFHAPIERYQLGNTTFSANRWDPALPSDIAPAIFSIAGLSTLSKPMPTYVFNYCSTQPKTLECVQTGLKQLNSLVSSLFCLLYQLGGYGLLGVGVGAVTTAAGGVAGGVYGGAAALGLGVCPVGNIWSQYNNFLHHTGDPGYASLQPSVHSTTHVRTVSASASSTPPPVAAGGGQTIGLLEFDAFHLSDVGDYLMLARGPSATTANLSVQPVNGGISTPGGGEDEVLLDIDMVMGVAPSAKVIVYESPSTGHASDYVSVFNAMINDQVTIISNSWASCENQVSKADALAIDSVLQTAAAAGISVFNGSGDSGSTCLDGSANTVSVPADSPNATAVGGTSIPNSYGPGPTYGAETWWDDAAGTPSTGQGGFGVSQYFTKPAYQNSLNTSSMRSVPDVVVQADPSTGVEICQANKGGCPSGLLYGGTSMAAPVWAAMTAVLNEAQGKNMGLLNASLYPLAGTPAFHSASSMGSDFAHVGLGSPNLNVMNRLLSGQALGPVSTTYSQVAPLFQSGTAVLTPSGAITVPADGSSLGGMLVTLRDANLNTLDGKTVTLAANSANAHISPASGVTSVSNGAIAFTVTDATAETVSFTATDTTDGVTLAPVTLTFGVPPAVSASISATPGSEPADGQSAAALIVTLHDALGRPTAGKAVNIAQSGGHAVVTAPTPAVTDANGVIQFSVTDQLNETVTFTALDVTDDNLPVPGSSSVTFSGSVTTACGAGVAPTAATGYAITPYISGLPAAASLYYGGINYGCPGAGNPAFTSAGNVLTPDSYTGGVYQTGLAGGAVTSGNLLFTLNPITGNFVYGKDGSLYASLGSSTGNYNGSSIVQIDLVTGRVLRTVASGLTCPVGLAIDPLSGDLFFANECNGAAADASIWRVIDPSNTDATKPTAVVVYATLPNTANGGLAFAPNGTLYAVSGYYSNPTAAVIQISGTNVATVTVAAVAGLASDFAVAIGAINSDGSAQSLIVEPNGNLTEVPLGTPSAGTLLASGAPGVGNTGPDGCLYSQHYDTIYRLAKSDGTCNFLPTSPAPTLTLTPTIITPNPTQGTTQTLKATLTNAGAGGGVAVSFLIKGPNGRLRSVDTDTAGHAVYAYTAALAGTDSVVATATVNGAPVVSNTASITWAAGKDVTFVVLDATRRAGIVGQPVTVSATLLDVTAGPKTPLANQPLILSLDSATCTASTSASGIATCQFTPATAGVLTLAANFAGTNTLVQSSDSAAFNSQVGAIAAPVPTVTISITPSTVAVGSSATLTWSSTNASTCSATGGWSGTQSISGTQALTPSVTGTTAYGLTCTGSGGSATASANLAASLAPVTVSAKSGGGATSWNWTACLAILVALRMLKTRAGHRIKSMRSCAWIVLTVFVLCMFGTHPTNAQPTLDMPTAALDKVYVGIRLGSMPELLDAGKINGQLASRGYSNVSTITDSSAFGETLYVGYELASHADVEFGFTHRDSHTATLSASVGSAAQTSQLARDATNVILGYGNVFAISLRPRFELAPRINIDPRVGGFVSSTKVTATVGGASVDETHTGGGFTVGVGLAYRLWQGLEIGIGADHYRGASHNIATLYGGSVEWRFGSR